MDVILVILTFFLAVIFLIPFFWEKKELITPLKIYALFAIITTIPYLINLSFDPSIVHYSLLHAIGLENIIEKSYYYVFVQSISTIALYIGYYSLPVTKSRNGLLGYANLKNLENTLVVYSFIIFIVAVIAFYFKLQGMGGLYNLLDNIEKRTSLATGSGAGYIGFVFEVTLYLSIVLYIYSFKYSVNIKKIIIITLYFLLAFVMLSIFGGRKGFMYLIVFSFIIWNYSVKPIQKIKIMHVLVALMVFLYFIVILMLRQPDAIDIYTSSPDLFFSDFSENLFIYLNNLSYVDTYIFIVDYFNFNNYWFGSVYLDLIKTPIPSAIMLDKPPMDEGVYIRSLLDGMNVSPPTPFSEMLQSSFPPQTIGNGYANFGIIGSISLMFILGVIYKVFYNRMKSTPSLLNSYMFAFVVVNFHISNLRIVQLLISFIIVWIVLSLIFTQKGRIRIFKL